MKLYIYGTCTICLGTGKTWYGRACPYCNHDARQFFEASRRSVIRYILEETEESEQLELYNILKEKLEKEDD